MNLIWDNVDWEILKALRDRFLGDVSARSTDYWVSEKELAHYALAFAPRIGWKWNAVLDEAKRAGWVLPAGTAVWDWGCGTGIAAERFHHFFPYPKAHLTDRSNRAREFAGLRLRARFVDVKFSVDPPDSRGYVLLLSHVINELTAEGFKALNRAIENASTVFWLEPGTFADSFALVEQRENWKSKFTPFAPCPHGQECGLWRIEKSQRRDWCHHFAPVPGEVFQTSHWSKFSKTMKIDLRSLPLSYLVLRKREVPEIGEVRPSTGRRLIGRARIYKGLAKVTLCDEKGVSEISIKTRENPSLVETLEQVPFSLTLPSASSTTLFSAGVELDRK